MCVLLCNAVHAATYVFGEDGKYQDLTGTGGPGSTWPTGNTYIIAGDCYIPDNATLTLQAGVVVSFDYDYDGDNTGYPTIQVKGTLKCYGTSINNVVFTNLSGTTSGKYEGLYLNSYGDYEGKLEGSFIQFLYGGRSSGIIRVGTDAILDIGNSIIRHSYKHGIYVENTGSTVTLDTCQVDSCAEDGVSWSEVQGDNCLLSISDCSFISNDSAAVRVPHRDPNRDDPVIVRRSFFQGHMWNILIIDDLENSVEINNNYFLGEAAPIIIINSGNDSEDFSSISNNAFCRCDHGIVIGDIDYALTVQSEPLHIAIRHNVFWDINHTGLHITGLAAEDDMDLYLQLDNNLFNEAGVNDIWVEGPPRDWLVSPFNIFEVADNCTGADNTYEGGPIIEGVNGASLRLRDEEDDGPPLEPNDYDFHIEWDGAPIMAINRDDNSQDPDGSDADYGCYGGPLGNFGVANFRGYYIALPPEDDPQTGTMPFATYYMFDDFLVPDDGAGTELTIEPGAHIIAKGVYRFLVEGTIVTGEEENGEPNSIIFEHNGAGNGWFGIRLSEDAAAGSQLRDLLVQDAVSYPGIDIYNVDGQNPVVIANVNVDDCITGVRIYNSDAEINGLTVSNSDYYGLYIFSCDANEVTIENLDSHNNFGNQAYSCGLNIYDSMPFIGLADNDNTESRIYDNYKYGMVCNEASPIMTGAGEEAEWGNIDIRSNNNSQIFLRDGSEPVIFSGLNNIMPDTNAQGVPQDYAVEFGANQPIDWLATDNYWGTDNPFGYQNQLFSDLQKIVFDDEQLEYIDNFNDFQTGLSLVSENQFREAIPHLKSAAEVENGIFRLTSLRMLRRCYRKSEGDFGELRRYLYRFAANCEDPNVAFTAISQAIMTLRDEGRYVECVAAFERRRFEVETLSDSIRNEKFLLSAALALEPNLRTDASFKWTTVSELEDHMAWLDALVDKQGNRKTINVNPISFRINSIYPNPFNSQMIVSIDIDKAGIIDVGVFDLTGRRTANITERYFDVGQHILTWKSESTPAGVYFIKVSGSNGIRTSRIALVR